MMCLGAPKASAAEETVHSHCVCGGSAVNAGNHTQCKNITWVPLSSVVTLDAVNWKNVPSGHYYLDGDVTVSAVTDGYSIGSAVKNDDGTTYTVESQEISLCLNGHSITTTKDRVFKGVYTGSTLNICDCSGEQVDGIWKWDGTIIGGTSSTGGITYMYANSLVNIYGGNLTAKDGQTAATGGGLFYVAQDRATVGNSIGQKSADYASTLNIYNGNLYGGSSAKSGGNIYVAHYSNLNVYGGYIHDGTAGNMGGNICFVSKGTILLQNANIYNGTAGTSGGNVYPVKDSRYTTNNIYGGYPECVHVVTGENISHEYSLATALTKVTDGSHLKLMKDLNAQIQKTDDAGETVSVDTEISGTVYLDMNGCDLSGVTVSGTVYGFDSSTDGMTGDNGGKLTGTVSGTVLAKEQYLMVNEEGYSFHRYNVAITHLSLKPANAAMGYKAQFQGDDALARNVSGFGYELWLDGYAPCTYSSKTFTSGKVLTLRLQNILSEDNTLEENLKNAETKIYAKAFIQLNDGTKVSCDQVSYDLKEMLNLADDCYTDYTTAQKNALQAMAGKFSETMMTWDVENFHHASGGMWTEKNGTTFIQNLVKDGSYYKIPAGSYVLTADVNIQSKTLKIATGDTVNICLNGHTITGTQRMMRIYGTLNLCDCHAHGESEGNMISSFTSESGHGAVFYTYYGSTFNLYGGNLKATGTLATSGVGAVSHEAQSTHPEIAPGVMNMYGGTLSGGSVKIYTKDDGSTSGGNGGLLALYHGATFNMYGGEMYGGYAESHGGAIHVGGTCSLNLYGGKIYDCEAAVGDGVYLTGSGTHHVENVQIYDNANTDVYIDSGTVSLAGDVQIGKLYLPYDAAMNTDAMATGASVGLTSDVHGFLSNNTQIADCFILDEGYTPAVVNGKLVAVQTGVTEVAQTDGFRVGYSSVCINPAQETGIPLSGFGNSSARLSTEIQEDLYASATAVTDADGNTVLLITCDLQRPQEAITDVIREHISLATGVPFENIILSASHSHSTPDLYSSSALIKEYKLLLYNNFTQAAIEAMASRVPATIQAGVVEEVTDPASGKFMNFTRHYSYIDADGNIQYHGDNFGTSPSTDAEKSTWAHVAEADHSMQLIRFVRDGDKDVIMCNWAAHPTMTGSSDKTVLSADYVGPLRDKVQAETDCYFAFVQGAAGNMNPTSRISGETPYAKAYYHEYGEALADVVIGQMDALACVDTGKVQSDQYIYAATVYKHTDEEVAQAIEFNKLTYEERRAQYKDWGYTSIYHASSIIAKANLGITEDLELNVFSIGDSLAFYSAPGELWAETGLKVKEYSRFAYTFTVGYSNGDWKYFTDGTAADGTYENYEGFYSRFIAPDTTQDMIAYWEEALDKLYNNL